MAPVLRKRKIENPSEEGKMAVVDPPRNRLIGSCKARRRTKIGNIPQELIFSILVCLPADFIYRVVRCVCQGWYNITRTPSFAHSHLQNLSSSTTCLFLQSRFGSTPESAYFLRTSSNTGAVEFKRLGRVPRGAVITSCNGLLYFGKHRSHREACVLNPVTGQQLVVPMFTHMTLAPLTNHFLAYSPVSGAYKVVQLRGYHLDKIPQFAIRTLGGVDKTWRSLDASYLHLPYHYFSVRPLCIGRFAYYVRGPRAKLIIVVFDIETETLWPISLPHARDPESPTKFLAVRGSLLVMTKVHSSYLIEAWRLVDPKSGRWEKLPDINLVDDPRLGRVMPIGSLQNGGDLLVFVAFGEIIVYHVQKGRIVASFQTADDYEFPDFPLDFYKWVCLPHVDSLVSLSPPAISKAK